MAIGRLKKAYYSAVTSALVQIVTIGCGMVTSRLIIQNYGSAWNGMISSITKVLSLITIAEMGVDGAARAALYKSVAENDEKRTNAIVNANYSYYRKITFCFIVYIALMMVVMPKMIRSDEPGLYIACMVGVIGVSNLAEHCWGINSKILLNAHQSKYITNLVQTGAVILNAVLLAMVVHAGGSVFAAKAASGAVLTIKPIILFVIAARLFRFDKTVKPDNVALKGRWDVMANSLSNIVHNNVDIVCLTIFCTSAEVSVYSIYYVVAGGLYKVFRVITNGMEAGFGSLWAKQELEKLKRYLRQFEFVMYSLAVLLFGCMIVLIVPFMSLYASGVSDANYLRFGLGLCMALAEIMVSVRTPYVLLVQAAGHYRQVKFGAYMEAALNIVLTVALVIRFGVVGAVIGTIIANLFRTIQYGWYASKEMIHRPFREIVYHLVWLVCMLGVSVVISMWVVNMIPIHTWLDWIGAATACFAIHSAVILAGAFLCYKSDVKVFADIVKRIVSK